VWWYRLGVAEELVTGSRKKWATIFVSVWVDLKKKGRFWSKVLGSNLVDLGQDRLEEEGGGSCTGKQAEKVDI